MAFMFVVIGVIVLGLLFVFLVTNTQRPPHYPPGPRWLPFVGNTPLLRRLARKMGGQHLVFEHWMATYKSPVIGLKLGSELVVVALTYPIVRDVHTRDEFDGRPDNFFLRLRTMGTRLGITCTDGALWAEQRSFATRHLRQAGFGRRPMEAQVATELDELLCYVSDISAATGTTESGTPVWPGSFLAPSVLSVLWTFTAGRRFTRTDQQLTRLLDLMQQRSKAFDMSGGTLSQMPWLRFFMPERIGYNLLCNLNSELHDFFMEAITDHHDSYTDERADDDLIYAFIREMRDQATNAETTFTDRQLVMTILDLFIAGSQTTSTTLDLALMMMLVRPDVQTSVQKELDAVVASGETLTLASRTRLPYCEAVLTEVQRFFHIVPITGPRRVLTTTELGGYRIPKEATVLIGLHTVHMDRDYWGDPDIFRPERFLSDDHQRIVNTERVLPFGQGHRRCLGEALARACICSFFWGIMLNYRLKLPMGDEMPSMRLLPGITLSPQPYRAVFEKRAQRNNASTGALTTM